MTDAEDRSVYQRVLGAAFDDLDPRLRRYFGMPPSDHVGHGVGVYDVAGSHHRWLAPALAWLGWRQVLFAEYGHGIPFEIVNTPHDRRLSARRTFAFPGRTRVMVDTMSAATTRSGARVLVDRLGRRRGLEVALHLSVDQGALRMRSGRQVLRLGGVRIPLPRVVRVDLLERIDEQHVDGPRQRVDVRMTAPVLGEVFRYAGAFTYDYVRASPEVD